MRLILGLLSLILIFTACNDRNKPDISHIKINIPVQRFDQELFTADTNNLKPFLEKMASENSEFFQIFLAKIIATDPTWSEDTTINYIKSFITAYRPVYDSSQLLYKDSKQEEKALNQAFSYLKYYFPSYPTPTKIVTFIGPLDGTGSVVLPTQVAVGLQQHLGSDFSLYNSDWVAQTYPNYISRRFTREAISVNMMKNILLDMYPEATPDKALIVRMVENGKKLYALQQLLPDVKEHVLIGYTEKQFTESKSHERIIWDFFIQNNMLQGNLKEINRAYVEEGPKTPELGESAPGNIGSFAGWQIVKKYMSMNSSTTLEELMKKDSETIYRESKYKP